jgi:hypothetical protein
VTLRLPAIFLDFDGVPYEFRDAHQLLADFFTEVDCVLEEIIWFTSMRSLAEVLSDENRALLKVIQDAKPQSISTLVGEQPRPSS